MESTPVSGVDIRNDKVAPSEAPCFFNDKAVGTTPHEQRGKGTPRREAFNTEEYLLPPRWRKILSSGKKTCRRPATRKPNRRYKDESLNIFSDSERIPFITIKIGSGPNCTVPRVFEKFPQQIENMLVIQGVVNHFALAPTPYQLGRTQEP